MATLDRQQRGDIHVLAPRKNLQGGDETRDLQQAVQEIVGQGVPKIVMDLGKISYMNSVGLGALVGAHTSCSNRKGWLRVARIGTRIKDLFLVTKLTLVFDSYETVEEAVDGVHKEGA
jgi:anti-sigma B factor antagonist